MCSERACSRQACSRAMPALHTPKALGSIFGKVTDSSGGVLPGVTVTVTGTGLQQPLVATTSESGTYQFPSVPIGTYTVTFELASFKKAQRVRTSSSPPASTPASIRSSRSAR